MESISSGQRRQTLFGAVRRAHLGRLVRAAGVVLSSWVAWAVVQTPRVAEACAVCSAGRDEENAAAFLISTIFMSLLPLIAIGSIVYLLWRRIQKFEAEKEARLEAGVSLSSPSTPPSSPRAESA
jgi:hypothetical protein